MQKIDLYNYEAYLLDFSEGTLTDEVQIELELFLIQHPELKINLNDLPSVFIELDNTNFSNKTILKKTEAHLVSEDQFISYIENQLTYEQRLVLEKSCAINPFLLKELNKYNHTIIKADMTVFFDNKYSLKRESKTIWFSVSITQYAAACVIFFIGLFMLWGKIGNIYSISSLANNKIHITRIPSINTNHSQFISDSLILRKDLSLKIKPNKLKKQSFIINDSIQQRLTSYTSISKKPNNNSIKDSCLINNELNSNQFTCSEQQKHIATSIQVVSEENDEPMLPSSERKKKGIWLKTIQALKNLNNIGVKAVNGEEQTSMENTKYGITLGSINITHKTGL